MNNRDKQMFLNILTRYKLDTTSSFSFNENQFMIQRSQKNNLFKEIFLFCSTREICFSIINTDYEKSELLIFLPNEEKKEYFLFFSSTDKKNHQENKNFEKEYNNCKKQKIVPVIGPDGVGKTTLLKEVICSIENKVLYKRFKKIVRRSILYNLMYPINKFLLKKRLNQKPTKDQVDDINAKLVIFCGIFYYPFLIFQTLVKNKLVFVDRFFNDYLLEDISFLDRPTTLRKNWTKVLRYIPKTFWLIHLDAKSEIILSRKGELLDDDILQYRELNFEIYLKKPSFVYTYINTGLEISLCKKILLEVGKKIEIFEVREVTCLK